MKQMRYLNPIHWWRTYKAIRGAALGLVEFTKRPSLCSYKKEGVPDCSLGALTAEEIRSAD